MSKTGLWNIKPLKNEIILTLIKYKGEMLDSDLLRNLQKQFPDLTKNILQKTLFKLEVEMIIDVIKIRKNVNKVGLRQSAPISDELIRELNGSIKN